MFRFGKKIFQSLPARLSIPSKGFFRGIQFMEILGSVDKNKLLNIPSNFGREGNPMNP